jgi:hypothetical protein
MAALCSSICFFDRFKNKVSLQQQGLVTISMCLQGQAGYYLNKSLGALLDVNDFYVLKLVRKCNSHFL